MSGCASCGDWCCPGCAPDDIDDLDDSWDGPADAVGGRGYTATGGVIM